MLSIMIDFDSHRVGQRPMPDHVMALARLVFKRLRETVSPPNPFSSGRQAASLAGSKASAGAMPLEASAEFEDPHGRSM